MRANMVGVSEREEIPPYADKGRVIYVV
jgi:hypothetical protein